MTNAARWEGEEAEQRKAQARAEVLGGRVEYRNAGSLPGQFEGGVYLTPAQAEALIGRLDGGAPRKEAR